MAKEIALHLAVGIIAISIWSFIVSRVTDGSFLLWMTLGVAFYVVTRGVYLVVQRRRKAKQ